MDSSNKVRNYCIHLLKININKKVRNKFTTILYCKDLATDFVFLRPLLSECDREIASELLQIFMTIGVPEKFVCVRKCHLNLFRQAIVQIGEWLSPVLLTGHQIQVKPCFEVVEEGSVAWNIKKNLIEWCTETESDNWELGCHILQWRLNSQTNDSLVNNTKEDTPYNSLFSGPCARPSSDSDEEDELLTAFENAVEEKNIQDSEAQIN